VVSYLAFMLEGIVLFFKFCTDTHDSLPPWKSNWR
jgi:hypothetical protein